MKKMASKIAAKKAMPNSNKATMVLGLLAGGGDLPSQVVQAAQQQGHPVHVVTFQGQDQPTKLVAKSVASQQQFQLGQVGPIVSHLKSSGVTHVVMAGYIRKPNLFSLKLDKHAMQLLGHLRLWHDDALLRAVSGFLQGQGLQVIPVTQLVPRLPVPVGTLSKRHPCVTHQRNAALGLQVLQHLGSLDIGQALIVHRNTVLGVEAAEGTDALIERCAPLRGAMQPGKRGGVLVKMAKPGQTNHADLPLVGPTTFHLLAKHHYAGVVLHAGHTLMLHPDECLAIANKAGLMVQSVVPPWEK